MSIPGIIIAVVLFIAGLAGTILPLLPGAILIYAGMLVYGFMTNFLTLTIEFFIIQGIITAIIMLTDYVAGAWGANRYGGSKASAWGSVIGGIIGVIVLNLPGLVIGPFIGAAAAELIQGEKSEKALKVGWGTIVGFLGGTAAKIILEIIMIIWFFIQVF